ncbi:MAG: sodium/solute symporter [Thermoguttaceae bacterium]|nr:sodium/solute symporter [Thermoguttaceae bacterium]
MNIRRLFFTAVLAAIAFVTSFSALAQENNSSLQWTVQQDVLPEAVARPFYGVVSKTNAAPGDVQKVALLFGGSYFDAPVADGGKKRYSQTVSQLVQETVDGKSVWKAKPVKVLVDGKESPEGLPEPIAEGVTVAFDSYLLLCGGANENGESTKVWKAEYNAQTSSVELTSMPDLPAPCSMGCGGAIKDGKTKQTIPYVIASGKLFALDGDKWVELDGIPDDVQNGVVRSQPAGAVRISNLDTIHDITSLFVFGGYDKAEGANGKPLYDVWKMQPTRDDAGALKSKWTRLADLEYKGERFCSIGSTAVVVGSESILLVGGVNADVWTEANEKLNTLTGEEKDAYLAEYYARTPESFNWEKRMFVYHTVIEEGAFFEKGNVTIPTPVCGAAVMNVNNQLLIVGGEVKPAQRWTGQQVLNLALNRSFGTVNWIVFLTYLGLMLPFGYIFMRKNKGIDDYCKGGGRIPWWVNGVAIFAAMLSSITYMTIPAMTFSSSWWMYPMTFAIFILAPIVVYFYLPFYRRLKITSAYEYLEKRFNVFSRVFASAAFIVFMIVRSAIVVYLPALALSVIIGMNLFASIILVGAVTVIYSTIGGVSAVIWSEFIQAVVLVGGALIAVALLIMGTDGGFSGVIQLACDNGKFQPFDFSWSLVEPVFWVTFIGGIAINLSSYTSDQTIVQKYMTTKDEKAAAHSIWFNGILSVLSCTLFYFIGTTLYAYYKSNAAQFDWSLYQNDAIFPTYIVSSLPTGVSGLLIAAIFAAAMSTLSANFNSASTAFVSDFYCRFIRNDQAAAFKVAKWASFISGTAAIAFALLIATIDIKSLFMEFQKVIGILTSGLAGLFVMGLFIPRINGAGAVAGLAASYVVNIVLIYTNIVPVKPHFLLYSVAGLLACVVVGYIVSLFTGKPTMEQLDGLTMKYMPKEVD